MALITIMLTLTPLKTNSKDEGEEKAKFYNKWHLQANHISRLKNPTKRDVIHLISISKKTCRMDKIFNLVIFKKNTPIAGFTPLGIGNNSKHIKKVAKIVTKKCKPKRK